MTAFVTANSKMGSYLMFPRFLLDAPVNETAKLLYMLLLDRAKLSMKKPEWADQTGRVFIHYPITKLAEALHKSETTVKTALSDLEDAGLILRARQGIGKPNRILPYGTYQNVFLTAEEYMDLRGRIRDLPGRINHLSEYMHRAGRTYSDHVATLLRWAEKDGKLIPQRNYEYQEGESL